MEFKGKGWREVVLEKRRRRYLIEDIFIILFWVFGIGLISTAFILLWGTRNWQLPLLLTIAGLMINVICAFADHGTITRQLFEEKETEDE